jgi:hypothetical protein
MKRQLLFLALALATSGTGCKTVVRENIISSVNTGIGVSLAENPKTEMYEVKVGYIRSQFYSVPTGKTVEGATSNAANVTPELVSGIRMNSDARHLLLGVSVIENFAVGKVAVMSPAAVAMYVGQTDNPQKSTAAAAAAASVSGEDARSIMAAVNDPQNVPLVDKLDALLQKPLKDPKPKKGNGADYASTTEYANDLANEIHPGRTLNGMRLRGGDDLKKLIEKLEPKLAP